MSEQGMTNPIPLSEPEISGNEWKYVKECLDKGWVSSVGQYVTRLEEALAQYVGTAYAVAVVNGTAALHLSMIACGLQPNEEVIVPTLTFIAPANVVRYCGAYPVFMDCDQNTLCMDVEKVTDFLINECVRNEDGLTYSKKTRRRIRAIIPVHVFGHPTDMGPLMDIATKYNIAIIEDATESLGSEYKGLKTGTFGIIGCFSFNGNKIITTGGGGMIVTNEAHLAEHMRHLSTQAKKDPLAYDHDEIGYNYRLSNIQAAMGVAQMERLEEFVAIKRKHALQYRELLSGLNKVELLWEKEWVKGNFWLYTIRVPREDREPLLKFLISRNIQARPVWKLIQSLPMYRHCQSYLVEKAPEAQERCLNLPSSVGLKESEIEYVVEAIKAYFRKF